MPARRQQEVLKRQFYTWIIYQRDGIWYADGRSGNPFNLGRKSLGSADKNEALVALDELDRRKAVEHNLADRSILEPQNSGLSIKDGRKEYESFIGRAPVAGGTRFSTKKRYRTVLDKFEKFCFKRGISYWNQVNSRVLEQYVTQLAADDYAQASQYLEVTTLKQVVCFLIDRGHLPSTARIKLKLRKPQGTTTYCYSGTEVQAMIERCESIPGLHWLRDVIVFLAFTGLRISELASLRWADLNFEAGLIHLNDEMNLARNHRQREVRRTKSGRSRMLPIHSQLSAVIQELPRNRDGYLLHGPLGGRLKPDTVRNILVRDVLEPLAPRFPATEYGKGFCDGRLHSFRHYFCSRCVANGIPELTIKEWLGHRDSKMVQHYYHLSNTESRRQIEKLSFEDTSREVREVG
ncbi:site-specific integrase [Telmatocola sphagniphila]|uniref:Site-specific integrase n=1 Tax=Telmatocola sphagniphila TaxID=1123043 RepID=A0A8E6EW96_9BACT|nr:site-specific integrase [Telmatocola sphagniphila]QVL30353.1 site-specific integrase [Telmatocola sphagniphila]